MPPHKAPDPLAIIAADVVATDPELQIRIKRIINALLNDAEYIIRVGTPADRSNLFRSVVPQLMRSMATADAGAEESEERKAFERLLGGLRGETGP